MVSIPLSVLRKQRAALDRAIRALEHFQRLGSSPNRKTQEAAAPPRCAKLLSIDAPAPPARKLADQ